ncbi:hypothetical protein ABNX05_17780 [Lysinibacillus sp. M3]|uniref:Uncharacterized protein n=1 Tax=Lysinibacillus zambalensis TaxID=3160866 RepID=A0ABV1MVE4_9BACI
MKKSLGGFLPNGNSYLGSVNERFPNLRINVSDILFLRRNSQLLKKIENFGLLCEDKKCISKSKGDLFDMKNTKKVIYQKVFDLMY